MGVQSSPIGHSVSTTGKVLKVTIIAMLMAVGMHSVSAHAAVVTVTANSNMNFNAGVPETLFLPVYGLMANVGQYNSAANFPLSSVPFGATISAATLHFDVRGYLNLKTDLVQASAYGRTGAFVAADSTTSTTPIGSFSSYGLGVGAFTLSFSPASLAVLQSLVGSGQDLGIRYDPISSPGESSLGSIETSLAPKVEITYTVPEPGSLVILCTASLALLRRRGRDSQSIFQ